MQALDEVRFKTNLVIDPVVVEDDKLGSAIGKVVETLGQTLKDLAGVDDLEVDLTEATPASSDDDANPEVDDAPVVQYIQKILLDAIATGVSDIHFEPYEKFYRIRYRLDGVLKEVAQPPLVIKDKMASRIKVISKLDISEKRVPQDGRMKLVRQQDALDRFSGQHAAHALRRKDRAAYSRFGRRQARHRSTRLRARPAGDVAQRHRPPVRHDPGHRPDG